MIPKPPACDGCPYRHRGAYMVPDLVRHQAKAGIWMQNPGEEEERVGIPAIGRTGLDQDRNFLPRAGLTRDDVSIFNALRCRIDGSNTLPEMNSKGKDADELRTAIRHCTQAHFNRPAGMTAVLATGDKAVYAASGGQERSADEWRGWAFPLRPTGTHWRASYWLPTPHDVPVLVTYHTAYLYRQPLHRPTVLRDWGKFARLLKGTWPRRLPTWQTGTPSPLPLHCAFDTEYSDMGLTRYSLADRDLNGWVIEADFHVPATLSHGGTVVMQNAPADLSHFVRLFHKTREDIRATTLVHDIMLKHAVLYAGYPHDLDYLGSMFTGYNRWKHLATTSPLDYSGGDAVGTMEVNRNLDRELAADPLSQRIYQEFLLPHIWNIERAHRTGMATYKANVVRFTEELTAQLHEAELMGQAAVGWPINLGSPGRKGHVALELYDVLKLPTKRGTR